MEPARHLKRGVTAGNPYQPQGRHRENSGMPRGMGLIPLGNRDRSKPEFNEVEERASDPNIRRI